MDSMDDEDRRIVQEMVGRFDSPSFIRRAKLVETSWDQLLQRAAAARRQRLTFVRLRLGQLHALAGGWEQIAEQLHVAEVSAYLQNLYDELQPRLLLPLDATSSRRTLRAAAVDLLEAMAFFNERWQRWLAKVDLKPVNQARADYKRYYLFEKECAVGSPVVARMGYQPLEPVTVDEVILQFPLLTLPRLA